MPCIACSYLFFKQDSIVLNPNDYTAINTVHLAYIALVLRWRSNSHHSSSNSSSSSSSFSSRLSAAYRSSCPHASVCGLFSEAGVTWDCFGSLDTIRFREREGERDDRDRCRWLAAVRHSIDEPVVKISTAQTQLGYRRPRRAITSLPI